MLKLKRGTKMSLEAKIQTLTEQLDTLTSVVSNLINVLENDAVIDYKDVEKIKEEAPKPKTTKSKTTKPKTTTKKKEVENDQDMIDTTLTEPDEKQQEELSEESSASSSSYTIDDCKNLSRTKMQAGVDRKKIKAAIANAGGDSLADLTEEQLQAAYEGINSL